MQIKYVQITVLALVLALQFLFEHLFPQKKEINNWKNERFNLFIGALNAVLVFVPAGILVQWLTFVNTHRLGLLNQWVVPFWLQLLTAVVVLDFWMYAWHQFNHRVPFLWKLHRFHHKDEKMNSTTALRFHALELLLSYPGKALVCTIFGIGYLPLLVYEVAFFCSVIIHHSNIYISLKADNRYRLLFASPRMHRIHHSKKQEETDSNYGGLFSFWDRLFGTWVAEPKGELVFGVPDEQ